MEPYSILMFCFGGMLFFYGLDLLVTGNYRLVMRNYQVKPKKPKEYTRQLGKMLMLVSLSPILSAVVAMLGEEDSMIPLAGITLVVSAVLFIWIGVKKIVTSPTGDSDEPLE